MGIAFFSHIQCASLKSHVGITFRAFTYSVDYGHNVNIALCPHIQCAYLICHASITFSAPTYNVD